MIRDKKGKTPLTVALEEKQIGCIQLLQAASHSTPISTQPARNPLGN
jgi:hypothetical protein